jgi:hypothetical protein
LAALLLGSVTVALGATQAHAVTQTSGKFNGEPAKLVVTATSGFTVDCSTPNGFKDFSGHIALTVGL